MANLGFLQILTLIFVAAKLFGLIAWSWWWVLCPLWVPLVVVIIGLMVFSVSYIVLNKGFPIL